MIFPDVSVEVWLAKYPFLRVITSTCDGCGSKRSTTKAFISKEYVGLESPSCDCGKSTHSAMYMVPICKKEIKTWDSASKANK